MRQKVVKLYEDCISNIFLNGRFDAREHRLHVLDYPVICVCSTCGSNLSVINGTILCEDILTCHVDDVGRIWDDAAVCIGHANRIPFSFLGVDMERYDKGREWGYVSVPYVVEMGGDGCVCR